MIEAGAVAREMKDWANMGYDQGELRESITSTRWSMYVLEGRLVVDGLTQSYSLYIVLVDV